MFTLRATLCEMVGLLNHNQLNLVHVCSVFEVAVGGKMQCGGGLSPEIVRDAKLWAAAEERGVTLRRRRGGWVALSSFLYF